MCAVLLWDQGWRTNSCTARAYERDHECAVLEDALTPELLWNQTWENTKTLRPCRKANQLARRFIKGNSLLQVQLYLLWCDAEKKFCFIKVPKNTKKAEKSFSGVTICKLHEQSFPRKMKLFNLSRVAVWLFIIDTVILKLCLSNCDSWRHTSLHWKGKVGINCSVSVSSVVTFLFPSITFGRAMLELLAVNQCGT